MNKKFDLVKNDYVNACDFGYSAKKLTFNLEFDWAVRNKGVYSEISASSRANVLWNNQIIGSLQLMGSISVVHHASFAVVLEQGDNVLQFDGTGISDSFGVTINDVKLTAPYTSATLIANGGFEVPALAVGTYIISNNGSFAGWNAAQFEIGTCKLYNSAWGSGQCAELDGDFNTRYTQVIYICS